MEKGLRICDTNLQGKKYSAAKKRNQKTVIPVFTDFYTNSCLHDDLFVQQQYVEILQ